MTKPNLWVLDIETRPNEVYSWQLFNQNIGINQIIRPSGVLCFAAQRLDDDKPEFHAEWQDKGYAGMVKRLYEIYDSADGVITYNGANFDTKWIKSCFVQEGYGPPSPSVDIDLYRVVRKHFQFASKKLDFVCGALGLDTKVKHSGMDLWHSCIRPDTREEGREARKLMRLYNETDVTITRDLYFRLLPWIHNHPNMGHFADDLEPRCVNCGSDKLVRRGWAYTTAGKARRYRCECGRWCKSRQTQRLVELRPV